MKKIVGALLGALLLCGLLTGCGRAGDTAAGSDPDREAEGAGSKYTFFFQDTEVAVNGDMAALTEKLGEPSSYFESESCAFQGLDKVYTYGGVIIRTYPEDGKDYVLSVELRDDTVSTREGLYVGAGREDVTTAYGEPTEETGAALRYVDGDCTLAFILEDGRVTDITYTSDEA